MIPEIEKMFENPNKWNRSKLSKKIHIAYYGKSNNFVMISLYNQFFNKLQIKISK